MPYRPQKRRASPSVSRNGNGTHHRGSYAARLAIARSTARKPSGRGVSALLAVALVGVVSVLGIISAGAIATGGAAAVTIATLDQGLPDVQAFRDLDFSEPTRIMDRSGKVELAQFWNERRRVVDFESIPPLVLDATTATEDDTFWDNPGFDLEATVNAFLTEAGGGGEPRRWLDHHAAARARAPAAGGDHHRRQHAGGPLPPQGQGAPAVLQAHAGLPRRGGQEGHHHGLPERDLLRHRTGHRGGG